MPTTHIASVLVTLASIGFLGSVFTRDAFFSLAAIAAFWIFIFAHTFYGATIDPVTLYAYVLAAVALASITGSVLVKLLGTGRLIDVWMMRSPLPVPNIAEDWNIPLFLLAVLFIFLAVFYVIAGTAPAVPGFWNGDIVITATAGWILFVLFLLLAIALIIMAGVQKRTSDKNFTISDAPGIYYFFAFGVMAALPAVFWHFADGLITSYATRGWTTFVIALILDIGLLLAGVAIEAWQAQRGQLLGHAPAEAVRRPYDGLYTGGSKWTSAVRIFFIALVHGLVFGIGSLATDATTAAAAKQVFWFPYLFLLFAIAAGIFAAAYILIVCLFAVNISSRDTSAIRHLSRSQPNPIPTHNPAPPMSNLDFGNTTRRRTNKNNDKVSLPSRLRKPSDNEQQKHKFTMNSLTLV